MIFHQSEQLTYIVLFFNPPLPLPVTSGEGRELVLVVEDIRGESPRVGEDALSKR